MVVYSIAGPRKTFRQRLRGVSMVSGGSMVLYLGVLMVAGVVALRRIVSRPEETKKAESVGWLNTTIPVESTKDSD